MKYEFTGKTIKQDGKTFKQIKRISDDAEIFGNAFVFGDAEVYGNAEVCGDAEVYGNARVCGNCLVYGNELVYDNEKVCGNKEETKDAYQIVKGAVCRAQCQRFDQGRLYPARWSHRNTQTRPLYPSDVSANLIFSTD